MIRIIVQNNTGEQSPIEIPEGVNLNLMEILKAAGYPIPATCGGMALCATCAVQVLSGIENLLPAADQELDMLDTLPDSNEATRLACQIRPGPEMDGMVIYIINN